MSRTRTPGRTVLTLKLEPLLGSRFQPTGFPNLGAATFERPGRDGWTNALILESVQSMANHLEATTWDTGRDEQVEALTGVPYLRILDEAGEFLTSSRLEGHRLNSSYIMDGFLDGELGRQWLCNRFGLVVGKPLNTRAVAAAVAELDPVSLVHGAYFPQGDWPWQPKIARALTCFIEAHDIREAVSGGVKRDSVINSHDDKEKDTEKEKASKSGYGSVPYPRIEYTAADIVCYVSVDHAQIRSYGLSEEGTELVSALVDFELAAAFIDDLRLRTACDLRLVDVSGGELPDLDTATARVGAAIAAVGPGTVRNLVWKERPKAAPKKSRKNTSEDSSSDTAIDTSSDD